MNSNALVEYIRQEVRNHYASDDSPALLLANLGSTLKRLGHWPPEDVDTQISLRGFIEKAHDPDLVIVRDPQSPAFVVVCTANKTDLIAKVIKQRQERADESLTLDSQSDDHGNALERFLAAQAKNVVKHILIPADIALILSKHK